MRGGTHAPGRAGRLPGELLDFPSAKKIRQDPIDRVGLLQEEKVGGVGKNFELGLRNLLRQLFGQNRGHDPVPGSGENQGGLTNEMGSVVAFKSHGRVGLAGKGMEGLQFSHSNDNTPVDQTGIRPVELSGCGKGHSLADDFFRGQAGQGGNLPPKSHGQFSIFRAPAGGGQGGPYVSPWMPAGAGSVNLFFLLLSFLYVMIFFKKLTPWDPFLGIIRGLLVAKGNE